MKHPILPAILAVAALGAVACSEPTDPALTEEQVVDAAVLADVAQASGDAIAMDVQNLIGAELFGGLGASGPLAGPPGDPGLPPGITVQRTRTCYDEAGTAQSECDRLTTASMRIQTTLDGTHTRVFTRPEGTDSMTASIHRTRDQVISGLLGIETSRTHNAVGTSADTTWFRGAMGRTRKVEESAVDSTIDVVFDLPRDLNPWPVSGTMVRRVVGQVTLTSDSGTVVRSVNRRVQVTFPTDSQGNVTIVINDRTCTLNLVTHRVGNCQ
jgi:hypothetical protein